MGNAQFDLEWDNELLEKAIKTKKFHKQRVKERVEKEKVKKAFAEMRVLLMIKKIPWENILSFMFQKNVEECLTTHQIAHFLASKFQYFSKSRCQKLALYLTQPYDEIPLVSLHNECSGLQLLTRLQEEIPCYKIWSAK